MVLRLVPCGVDPQDAAVHCAARDVGDDSRAVVVTRVVPAKRVVDDLDPIGQAVRHGLVQIDLVADLDQRELGVRSDVVDDLGDSGAVGNPARQACAREVVLANAGRQVTASLSLGEPIEAQVNDGDPNSGTGDSRAAVDVRMDGRSPFAQRSERVGLVRRPHKSDAAQLRHKGRELADGHGYLDQRRRGVNG